MQLFCIKIEKYNLTNIWDFFEISDTDIFLQTTKVLRYKIWDVFFVQDFGYPKFRIKLEILHFDKKNNIIKTKITEKIFLKNKNSPTNWKTENTKIIKKIIICAIPNKFEKMEFITQKLTEIWIDNIVFWTSNRSIIRQLSESKLQRLTKISKEATEQSWSDHNTEITFDQKIDKYLENSQIFVFDKKEWMDDTKFQDNNSKKSSTKSKDWKNTILDKNNEFCDLQSQNEIYDIQYLDLQNNNKNLSKNTKTKNNIVGIVWPEWWLSKIDYQNRSDKNFEIINLWKNVFRTETACIIAWWEIHKL